MSIGSIPDLLSQRILVGRILVGRLGVIPGREGRKASSVRRPETGARQSPAARGLFKTYTMIYANRII